MSLDLFTPGLAKVAATPPEGFALQDATPVILSWIAPNDGQIHRYLIFSVLDVSSGETGGQVNLSVTDPAGVAVNTPFYNGDLGSSPYSSGASPWHIAIIQSGTTVSIGQATALTAGAATLWAEIWAA